MIRTLAFEEYNFMENLLHYISQRISIGEKLHIEITQCFEELNVNKGDILLEEGKVAHYMYFIEKGFLHTFYNLDGKKVTSWFYDELQCITSWSSFYARKPSFESIECLENGVLYRISYSNFQKLIVKFPEFSNFARLQSEEILIVIDEFSKSWAFLTAEQKYKVLLEYSPQIELRVKLGLIASFLGISQETLSRLRARN